MRDEGGPGHVVGFGGEVGVLPGSDRLLAHLRVPLAVEDAKPGAVRVSPALRGEVVRSVQQPKGGGDNVSPGMQPEKSAHGQAVSKVDSVSSDRRA